MDQLKQLNQKALALSGSSNNSLIKTSLDEFLAIIAELSAAYPRDSMSMATIVKYHQRLCRYSSKRIKAAIDLAIDSNQSDFVPSIGRIISLIQAQPVDTGVKLLAEPRPSGQELEAVKSTLSDLVKHFGGVDEEVRSRRLRERRELLKAQAQELEKAKSD